VKIQEIAVSNAESQLGFIQNQIAESTIFSPINGIVSVQNAKTGETASAGTPLIGIFSNSRPQIDVYLAESDIAKIKTGQTATVTMDAIGGKTFGAHVIGTDPGSQKIGSAQSYKTTLQFDQNIGDIKLGMTANVNIDVSQRDNVVAIPARSIIKKNDKSFVMVKIDDQRSDEREITTGITGQNGYIEVIDGLKEGEMIINY
jgi:HlyD family secretion protein